MSCIHHRRLVQNRLGTMGTTARSRFVHLSDGDRTFGAILGRKTNRNSALKNTKNQRHRSGSAPVAISKIIKKTRAKIAVKSFGRLLVLIVNIATIL